jgi:predicted permease
LTLTASWFDLDRLPYDATLSFAFHRALSERLAANGLEVAYVEPVPLSGNRNGTAITMQGQDKHLLIYNSWVSSNYFQVTGIPIVRGAGFDENASTVANEVVVSESTARQFWPGENPIGKQFEALDRRSTTLWQVVGVAKDVRSLVLSQVDSSLVYFPLRHDRYRYVSILVRSPSSAASVAAIIRREAGAVDSQVQVAAAPLSDNFKIWEAPARISSTMGFILGIAGLLLASMGIYGVVAYTVSQRTREIGIRMSLGAGKAEIVRMILAQTLRPVAAGVVVGLIGCAAVSRLLESLLFGVSPLDPLVSGGVSIFLAAVALLAAYAPARRAAKVDPMIALRYE